MNYLVGRGINSEIQEIFHVGFCPSDEDLINYFKKKEITKNDLFESDLLIKNKQNQFLEDLGTELHFQSLTLEIRSLVLVEELLMNQK